jgi:tight adherence protein B
VTGVVLAMAAAAGTYYLFTALALGWRGVRIGPGPGRRASRPPRRRVGDWLVQAGLDVSAREFVAVTGVMAVVGAVLGLTLFGGPVPALVVGLCAGASPVASYRRRRSRLRAEAQEAWPRLLEEIRVLTSGLGRSIPQALFEAGRGAPEGLRDGFAAAHREWLLSTDFLRTVAVLKASLADPTADAACETLLVAHEVGGSDLDRRLAALIEDRVIDVQGRKDARSRQAGVVFARRFVLLVPVGMALVGMTVGTGRQAYGTAWGQVMVVLGVLAVAGCWAWAGRLLRLPEEQRVFYE